MCSSGFLQGLIGSPTQCGLPVVVIVPLSLLAPGTHGHPSLSISTPPPGNHQLHCHTPSYILAMPAPWTYSPLVAKHLGMRLQSGLGPIVGITGRTDGHTPWYTISYTLVYASLGNPMGILPRIHKIPRNTPVMSVQTHCGYPCMHVCNQMVGQGVSQNPVGPAYRATAVVPWIGHISMSTMYI